MPLLDRLSTVNEPRDASSYSCWNCTCGRIGSCILVGTAHVARQASAYSLWNCTCGKIGSCKVELHMWEKCDSLRYTVITIFLVGPPIESVLDILGALLRHLLLYLLTSIHEWFMMARVRYTVVWTVEKEIKLLIGPKQFFSPFDSWKRNHNKNS